MTRIKLGGNRLTVLLPKVVHPLCSVSFNQLVVLIINTGDWLTNKKHSTK